MASTQGDEPEPFSTPFTLTVPQKQLQLLELTDELAKLYEETPSSSAVLKLKSGVNRSHAEGDSRGDGHLRLLSDSKAWDVRQVKTSNSVYVVDTRNISAQRPGTKRPKQPSDGTAETRDTDHNGMSSMPSLSAISQVDAVLELFSSALDDIGPDTVEKYIHSLVPIFPYTEDGSLETLTGSRITKNDVYDSIGAPDRLLNETWDKMCAFELPDDPQVPEELRLACAIPPPELLLDIWLMEQENLLEPDGFYVGRPQGESDVPMEGIEYSHPPRAWALSYAAVRHQMFGPYFRAHGVYETEQNGRGDSSAPSGRQGTNMSEWPSQKTWTQGLVFDERGRLKMHPRKLAAWVGRRLLQTITSSDIDGATFEGLSRHYIAAERGREERDRRTVRVAAFLGIWQGLLPSWHDGSSASWKSLCTLDTLTSSELSDESSQVCLRALLSNNDSPVPVVSGNTEPDGITWLSKDQLRKMPAGAKAQGGPNIGINAGGGKKKIGKWHEKFGAQRGSQQTPT